MSLINLKKSFNMTPWLHFLKSKCLWIFNLSYQIFFIVEKKYKSELKFSYRSCMKHNTASDFRLSRL